METSRCDTNSDKQSIIGVENGRLSRLGSLYNSALGELEHDNCRAALRPLKRDCQSPGKTLNGAVPAVLTDLPEGSGWPR
jgi:hypothetical protein